MSYKETVRLKSLIYRMLSNLKKGSLVVKIESWKKNSFKCIYFWNYVHKHFYYKHSGSYIHFSIICFMSKLALCAGFCFFAFRVYLAFHYKVKKWELVVRYHLLMGLQCETDRSFFGCSITSFLRLVNWVHLVFV